MTKIRDPSGIAAFIRAHCSVMPVAMLPEIRLYQAGELDPLWRQTERSLEALGIGLPFWAFAWAGGQALSRYLLDHPETLRGRATLDCAAGSGLVAIAAASAGAGPIIASDIDPFALAAIGLNAALNDVAIDVIGLDLASASENLPLRPDVILAGDVFYDVELARHALATFERLKRKGCKILVGDPGRSYFPADRFDLLAEYGVPVSRELEDSEIKHSRVWAFHG